MIVLPQAVELHELPVMVCWVLGALGLIVPSAMATVAIRRAEIAAGRKILLQAWQLRQLVPSPSPRGADQRA